MRERERERERKRESREGKYISNIAQESGSRKRFEMSALLAYCVLSYILEYKDNFRTNFVLWHKFCFMELTSTHMVVRFDSEN